MGRPGKARRLSERLPGLASWAPVIRAIIIETGTYKIFVQQCRDTTLDFAQAPRELPTPTLRRDRLRGKGALAPSSGLARLEGHHWRVVTIFYLYNLVKYRLLALINDQSGHLQGLDCFIPGRFRFVGRTNKISGEIASVFMLWFLIYRLAIHLRKPAFKFYALEFLLSSRTEVLENELKAGPDRTLRAPSREAAAAAAAATTTTTTTTTAQIKKTTPTTASKEAGKAKSIGAVSSIKSEQQLDDTTASGINSMFFARSPFEPSGTKWILRPNRTSESWLALNLSIKLLCYFLFLMTTYSFGIFYWSLAGPVLTNLGFEMAYPACVAWLRDVQWAPRPANATSYHNDYSFIYQAPKVLAHEIPIDQIPARIPIDTRDLRLATPFRLVWIALDIGDNHLVYFECFMLLAGLWCQLVIQCLDVSLNAAGLRARLERLIEALRLQVGAVRGHENRAKTHLRPSEWHDPARWGNSSPGTSTSNWTHPHLTSSQGFVMSSNGLGERSNRPGFASAAEGPTPEGGLDEEVDTIQALLADHFGTITRGYSCFFSFFMCHLALLWLHYTLTLCYWMSTNRSRAVEFEFLIAQSTAFLSCIFFLSCAACVRSCNLRLYPLVTRAMALDSNYMVTKLRWATIIKYFYPKPHFCFTIKGNLEISWLFCFKLLCWMFSAFVMLANFFYMNRT